MILNDREAGRRATPVFPIVIRTGEGAPAQKRKGSTQSGGAETINLSVAARTVVQQIQLAIRAR